MVTWGVNEAYVAEYGERLVLLTRMPSSRGWELARIERGNAAQTSRHETLHAAKIAARIWLLEE